MNRVPPFVPFPIGNAGAMIGYDTRAGARLLAQRIRDVWARHGHKVACDVAPVYDTAGRIVSYSLKSSLLNGLPRAVLGRNG